MKKIDLQALTLVGSSVTRPVQDPLAVLRVVSTVVSGVLFAHFSTVKCINKACSFLLRAVKGSISSLISFFYS